MKAEGPPIFCPATRIQPGGCQAFEKYLDTCQGLERAFEIGLRDLRGRLNLLEGESVIVVEQQADAHLVGVHTQLVLP